MNLFESTQRSWQLLQSSVFVARKHPKLLLFPILTGVFTVLIGAIFMAPIIQVAVQHPPAPNAGPFETLATYPRWVVPYGLVLYPLSLFLATFCNVAFYSQIMAALSGDEVSIRRGLKVALSRFKSICVWSLFGGLVGGLIRELESRLGFLGRIITGLVGLAWSVACIFVTPIIIREPSTGNPVNLLKKSAATIKRTWGETLACYTGLGIANIIVLASSLVLLFLVILVAVSLSSGWLALLSALIWLAAILAYGCIASVASQTYLCALYIYASEGVIPEPYDQSLLDRAWKIRKT